MTSEHPFAPVLAPEAFFETLGVAEALRRLEHGLGEREPFMLVTGEPGIGKTAIANRAIARWGARACVAYVAFPALSGGEMIGELLRRFSADPHDGASRPKLVGYFESTLGEITSRGEVAVIVVDDAHHLPAAQLEELRLLVNAASQAGRKLEVLLLGLPVLDARLEEPGLAALRQRISVRARLEPLSPGDARRYIRHRVEAAGDRSNPFGRRACAEVAAASAGIPRQINAIAGEALRLARAMGQPIVEPGLVRDAVATLSGRLPKGEVEELVDSGAEGAVDPMDMRPHAPAPVPREATPRPAPPPRPRPAPVPSIAAEAPREATPVAADPARPIPSDTDGMEDDLFRTPNPPAAHDPGEWVKRFVGEKGPLQLQTLVGAREPIVPEPTDPEATETDADAESPRPRQKLLTKFRNVGGPRQAVGWKKPNLRVITTAALVTIAVLGVTFIVIRATQNAGRHDPQAASASATTSAPNTNLAVRGSAPSTAPSAASSKAAAAQPEGSGPYTLEVGSATDWETARAMREQMHSLTGFEGFIVPVSETGPFRIMVGAYRNRERAQSAANHLLRSKTLPSVNVVPLPPKESRQ